MTSRKDTLKALFAADPAEEASLRDEASVRSSKDAEGMKGAQSAPSPLPSKRMASGAVKAMGLSLGHIADEIEDIRRQKKQVGEQIAVLDPGLIDGAMIADRLSSGADNDEQFASLLESMRDSGQQVPVLVRPHPDEKKRNEGYYQAAYGHRRICAARELGIGVQAIVRDLSDEALVMAQGKENAERRDLSFIERAFFAKRMIDHGFDRATAQSALGVHKAEMSRFLQVADRIPDRFVRAVGPAPKAGRPRWLALADLLARSANIDKAIDEIGKPAFRTASSDQRFQMLYARLTRQNRREKPLAIKNKEGSLIAEIKGRALKLSREVPDGFMEYLADELPELMAKFEEHGGGQ